MTAIRTTAASGTRGRHDGNAVFFVFSSPGTPMIIAAIFRQELKSVIWDAEQYVFCFAAVSCCWTP